MKQNGNVVKVGKKTVEVNGVEYPKPKPLFGCSTVNQINGELWVNGYKFKDGKFVKPNVFMRLFGWLIN